MDRDCVKCSDTHAGAETAESHARLPPGAQSGLIGAAVRAVLARDPRKFAQVVRAMHGRPLPPSLRAYVWMEVLLRQERDKLNDP